MIVYCVSRYTGKDFGMARVLTYPKRPYDIATDAKHCSMLELYRMKHTASVGHNMRRTESSPAQYFTSTRRKKKPPQWTGTRGPDGGLFTDKPEGVV